MFSTVTRSDFQDAFNRCSQTKDSFTYEALNALFDYFEELEESGCGAVELDPIATHCEWTEYDDLADVIAQYNQIKSLEDLQDNTQVIEIDGTSRLLVHEF